MELPRIYLVRGVDRNRTLRCPVHIHYDSYHTIRETRCPDCRRPFDAALGRLMVYSRELASIDASSPGFLACDDDYRLVALYEEIMALSSDLRGTVPLRLGYGTMHDGAIPDRDNEVFDASEWYSIPPFLGMLRVTGRCTNAFDASGVCLPRCTACGRLRDLNWATSQPEQIRLDPCFWDGTDVFRVEHSYLPILTAQGVSTLHRHGFQNLMLEELAWHE